jgi:hypothetical protein
MTLTNDAVLLEMVADTFNAECSLSPMIAAPSCKAAKEMAAALHFRYGAFTESRSGDYGVLSAGRCAITFRLDCKECGATETDADPRCAGCAGHSEWVAS